MKELYKKLVKEILRIILAAVLASLGLEGLSSFDCTPLENTSEVCR